MGENVSCRSTDVVLSLLHPVHRVDPYCAWVYRCLVQLRRMCLRRSDLKERIFDVMEWVLALRVGFGPCDSFKKLPLSDWHGNGTILKTFLFACPVNFMAFSLAIFLSTSGYVKPYVRKICPIANKRLDLRGISQPCGPLYTRSNFEKKCPTIGGARFSAIISGGF